MLPEDRAQKPWEGEDATPVRDRLEHVFLDPLAVKQHALLVATRAEVAGLARVREQVVVSAGIAVDAGKAMMRIQNGVNWGEARLAVRLRDDSILRQACSHAKGWPERPCSWQDLCEKFEDCAAAVLDHGQIRDAIAMIAKLEQLHSVRELIGVLVPSRAR